MANLSSRTTSVTPSAISYTDTVKTSYACNTILDQSFIDSTFYGEIEFSQTEAGPTGALVYIERAVPNSEQTEDDGSYTRFEAGRALKGVYYTAEGAAVNFEVTLESACSLATFAGLTLASCIGLLSF